MADVACHSCLTVSRGKMEKRHEKLHACSEDLVTRGQKLLTLMCGRLKAVSHPVSFHSLFMVVQI